jgi:phosphoribosylaminoimidazole-succinocarboxamide synthase
MNISFDEMKKIVSEDTAQRLKDLTLQVYGKARDFAEKKGIIIADTKMEFGIFNGEIILIDELLTPDSSRFWSIKDFAPGRSQDSFDKQIVRDYLLTLDWDQTAWPKLPMISKKTLQDIKKY